MTEVEAAETGAAANSSVLAAIPGWVNSLLDMSRRNQLLYLKDNGKVDLSTAEPVALGRLLEGNKVRLSQLFPDSEVRQPLVRVVRALRTKIKEFDEDRGVRVGRAVSCMTTWDSADPKDVRDPLRAPLLLRYLNVTQPLAASDEFEFVLDPDVEVNRLLLFALERQHGVKLTTAQIETIEEAAETDFYTADEASLLFTLAAGEIPGLETSPSLLLGYFQYQKLPMVEDLTVNADLFAESDLVQAVAGDGQAMQRIRVEAGQVTRTDPNFVVPSDEFLVLDADPSQNFAINAALAGRNIVIQGPPGTGKSQTIANLLASCMARGKRVMFVAEKRAAIDAVLTRLEAVGLAGGVFDLHDGAANKRRVVEEISRCISEARDTPIPAVDEVLRRVEGTRNQLLEHSKALHEPRDPWGISLFEAQATVLGTPESCRPEALISRELLLSLTPERRRTSVDALKWAAEAGAFLPESQRGPWAPASGLMPEQVESAYFTAKELASDLLPRLTREGAVALEQVGLKTPTNLDGWADCSKLLTETNASLDAWDGFVWTADLTELTADLAPKNVRVAQGRKVTWGMRRQAKKRFKALRTTHSAADPYAALTQLEGIKAQWTSLSTKGTRPTKCAKASDIGNLMLAVRMAVATLETHLGSGVMSSLALTDLEVKARDLARDASAIGRVAAANQAVKELEALGMERVVESIEAISRSWSLTEQVTNACSVFAYLEADGIVEAVTLKDAHFRAFDGTSHHVTLGEFQKSDREHRNATPTRIRRLRAERLTAARNSYPDQDRYLDVELRRKRRIKPLRELLTEAEDVIMAAKPCWAMSPLVVSQSLPPTLKFDIVVFDEASQIRPADAVTALGRATQAVVCGDSKQLPPTSFGQESLALDYDEQSDEEDADESQTGSTGQMNFGDLAVDAESILDVFETALGDTLASQYRLLWHYRSRDARLIDFSNNYFYDNSLMTFPGTLQESPVVLDEVEQIVGRYAKADDEVDAVVDAIFTHVSARPEKSLGVIALGIKHANRIQSAFQTRLRDSGPTSQAFFSESAAEPFFIKNLERVQGDERDYIILTPGYVKDATGKLPLRFGTLNNKGGERRINVAVSRAKEQVRVVSSFSHLDLDPERVNSEGGKVLGYYLKFAASGGEDLGDGGIRDVPLNPFEIHMRDRLLAAGIPVVAQYGVGSYRLDFAAKHPERPGQMVLAIEADGAAYHSSETARARDRLRQEHLERLGWKFCRVWSTDYFRDPDREIARVKAAYEAALAQTEGDGVPPDLVEAREAVQAPVSAHVRDQRRPSVPSDQPIDYYTDSQLIGLARWIVSDGRLRSDDELVQEMMGELGFSRRGAKIMARLQDAVRDRYNEVGA